MGRLSNTDERRAQIVRGLREAMAEHGYDGASVQAIARAAGLSPGLVHYHFANKRAVLLALHDELVAGFRARFAQGLEEAHTPWERLEAWMDARTALGPGADREAVACWVLLGGEAVRQPDVRTLREASMREELGTLEALVAEVLDADASEERVRRIAAILLATVEGSFALSLTAASVWPTGIAASGLRDVARGLIQGER